MFSSSLSEKKPIKIHKGKDLDGRGSRISLCSLDLSLKVVITMDLAGSWRLICIICGASSLAM